MQRAIQESAYRQQQQLETGQRIVVGINAFRDDEAAPGDPATPGAPDLIAGRRLLRIDPSLEAAQVTRVRELRAARDSGLVRAALAAVEERARAGDPLMPTLIDAALASATVGEITDRLRAAFGEHKEVLVV